MHYWQGTLLYRSFVTLNMALIYIHSCTHTYNHFQTAIYIIYKYWGPIAVQKSYYYYVFSGLCIAFWEICSSLICLLSWTISSSCSSILCFKLWITYNKEWKHMFVFLPFYNEAICRSYLFCSTLKPHIPCHWCWRGHSEVTEMHLVALRDQSWSADWYTWPKVASC